MKILKINKGFSLVEIIISIAILAIMFSFIFYFVSTINLKSLNIDNRPYMKTGYNYSNKYCYLEDGQLERLSIIKDLDMSTYISTGTPITSINIFHKDRLILTTNSASTSEADIFIFDFNSLNLISSLDVGPGINDSLLIDNTFYALNTSVNSHVKTFKINFDNDSMSIVSDIKISELSESYSLPKKIYLYNKNILIGSEKNNSGGELSVLPLDENNIPQSPIKSIEIDGQVNSIYEDNNYLYIANASDIELFVYDKDFNLDKYYDAPLSLGNGKSVYFLNPYTYLGRTVSSFELFFLDIKDGILNLIDKYKTSGSIDFIQKIDQYIIIFANSENKELQFFSHDMDLKKTLDLPSRVNIYDCFQNTVLTAHIINNQSHILWIK
jgi:prepilin-type N-terminal cleavage/methylation domain-containing protein